jgi:hypothetical protein
MSAKPPRITPPKPAEEDFWKTKSLEELSAEQGVQPIGRLEEFRGKGAELWANDAELDAFLQALRERRRKGENC